MAPAPASASPDGSLPPRTAPATFHLQPASQPCLLPGLKQVKVSSFLFSSHLPYLTQEAAANHCDPGETCGSRALRIIGKVGWGKRGPGPFKHRVSARTLPG